MEYFKTDGDIIHLSNTAVTLGKFDGIHRGHRQLVDEVLKKKEDGNTAVMFAFDMSDQMIYSREERRQLLENLGLDVLIECRLTEKMRCMKAETFVKEILVGDLHVSEVVIGEDYRFGHERKGDHELLKKLGTKYGFDTVVIPKEMEGRRKVSSTYIREELKAGRMERVRKLLGRDFFLNGTVVHGAGIGHKVLLPTINLIPPEDKLMPPNGVYFTVSHFGSRSIQGITNIGYKPTVNGSFLGVETYLFDTHEDLYEKECRIDFLHYERPEKTFANINELKNQLLKDADNGKKWFTA